MADGVVGNGSPASETNRHAFRLIGYELPTRKPQRQPVHRPLKTIGLIPARSVHSPIISVDRQRGSRPTGGIVGEDNEVQPQIKSTTCPFERGKTAQSHPTVSDTPWVRIPPGGLTYIKGRCAKRCLMHSRNSETHLLPHRPRIE